MTPCNRWAWLRPATTFGQSSAAIKAINPNHAEVLFKQVEEASTALHGADHPDTLRIIGNRGALYVYMERYSDAENISVDRSINHKLTQLLTMELPHATRRGYVTKVF